MPRVKRGVTTHKRHKKVLALIINGAGKNFCIGDDIMELYNRSSLYAKNFLEANIGVMQMIADFPKGTVVAVHGTTVMTGAWIAAIGDITVMADNARIGFTAINYGISCVIAIHHLRRVVGSKKALELVLTGDVLNADEALRIGLVSKVVPAEKLEETTYELATKIAKGPPLAIRLMKSQVLKGLETDLQTALDSAALCEAITMTSLDFQEALQARFGPGEPNFLGR